MFSRWPPDVHEVMSEVIGCMWLLNIREERKALVSPYYWKYAKLSLNAYSSGHNETYI